MTFFDFLREILFTKNRKEKHSDEDLKNLSPFLLNRWLSFYNKEVATLINSTCNRNYAFFENREDTYNFFFNLIPRLKFKKINYIKKLKKQEEEVTDIAVIATNKNISQREVKQYMDLRLKQNI